MNDTDTPHLPQRTPAQQPVYGGDLGRETDPAHLARVLTHLQALDPATLPQRAHPKSLAVTSNSKET
ncbi:hypothetical protein ACWDSJ_28085 [Nocardia sp. NPDC003482]